MPRTADTGTEQPEPPLGAFFALVFALSVPFWALGALSAAEILPALPVSSLMVVTPAAAALILSYRAHGRAGALALWRRLWDWRRIPSAGWGLALAGFMPLALLAAWGLMRLAEVEMPAIQWSLGLLALFLVMFFLAAAVEEMGWVGYASDPMIARFGVFGAGIVLGLIWTLWHAIPYVQTGRGLEWILWHSLVTVLLRVVMMWFYARGGRSVFGAVLFHTMSNVAFFLFPAMGSHYDPAFLLPVLAAAAAAMILSDVLRRWRGARLD